MEYIIRPKLQINRYKKQSPSNMLFRKIAHEIDHETQAKLNFSLDYDLSLWLIQLLSLNPKYGRLFNRSAVNILIKDYLKIVSDPDSVFVAIVNMQVYYINNSIDKTQIVAKHQNEMREKMKPLTRSIIDTRLKSKTECDEYVKKLAVDIIAQSALGNAKNEQVVQETINALKSMMSANDVMAFSMLCEKDKIESLSGIREIVCGMRAFNKDAGHCGEGLVDLEQTVRHGYKATKLQLSASLREITNRIELLMTPLGKQAASLDMLPNLIEKNNLIKTITLHRQCERFLYDLLSTLVDHQTHVDRCLKNFRSQLNRIHEIVKFRTAIPITSIFPKFIELAKFWIQLQHQTYILSEINTVNGQLMLLVKTHSYSSCARDLQALTTSPNYGVNGGVNGDKSSYGVGQKVFQPKIMNGSKNEQIKIVPYELNLKIEYESFCAWTLSCTDGLLLPADLTNGLVRFKNQYYAFSTVTAADCFMQNPHTCLMNIMGVICRNPELALFFDVYDSLEQKYAIKPNHSTYDYDQNTSLDWMEQYSVAIQTDIHPIPFGKDKNYAWNVWDRRREAIKLANLQKCRTKSTQTTCQSSFATQTYR